MEKLIFSIIIPIYKSEESLSRLIDSLTKLNIALGQQMEAVFVVDGSPDNSFHWLKDGLPKLPFSDRKW